jgi:hypothetical protein
MENTNEAQLINLEHELLPPDNLAAPDIPKQSHRELWNELIKENEDIRKEVEEYKQSKLQELEAPPRITLISTYLFVLKICKLQILSLNI